MMGAYLDRQKAALPFLKLILLLPGLAISLAVLGFNLVGDGLRDLSDPRVNKVHSGGGIMTSGDNRCAPQSNAPAMAQSSTSSSDMPSNSRST